MNSRFTGSGSGNLSQCHTTIRSELIAAFEEAGLSVQHHRTGAMGLLNLRQMLRDEGLWILRGFGGMC